MPEWDRYGQPLNPDNEGEHGAEREAQDPRFRRQERSPLVEMLSSGDRAEVLQAVRIICANQEEGLIVDGQGPDDFLVRNAKSTLQERRRTVKFIYPLSPFEEYTRYDRRLGTAVTEKAERAGLKTGDERKSFSDFLDRMYRELLARDTFRKKLEEQMVFSGDAGDYAKSFVRYGKATIPSRYYEIMLSAEASHEGFSPFGKKVETAFNAFMDIGRGKAEVVLDNGARKKLPNIFSMPENHGLMKFALEKYVLPKVRMVPREGREPQPPNFGQMPEGDRQNMQRTWEEAINEFEEFDDEAAAILAYGLFRHWDYDVEFSLGRRGGGKPMGETITDEERSQLNLETSGFGKDTSKMRWLPVRRVLEWGMTEKGGKGRREHVRPAGNPMTLLSYPILTASALEIMTTEVPLTGPQRNEIERNLGGSARNFDIPRTMRISVHDLAFGDEALGFRTKVQVKSKDGRDKRIVEFGYDRRSLADMDWERVRVVNADTNDEYVKFSEGVPTGAFEVPYKLQVFCAYNGLYSQIMREDYIDQYNEAIGVGGSKGNGLLRMNKPIDTALGMMATAYHLSDSTVGKLNNFIRAVYLGSLAAAVTRSGDTKNFEQDDRIPSYERDSTFDNKKFKNLLEAATLQNFLPLREGNMVGSDFGFIGLAELVFKERRGLRPSEAKVGGRPLFTEGELKELRPLYPLGV